MNIVLALVVIACVALLVLAVIVALDSQRHRQLAKALMERSNDQAVFRDHILATTAAFTNTLTLLTQRSAGEMKLVLDAAVADRDRVLTALLAVTSPGGQSAKVVGMVDREVANRTREMSMREMLEESFASRDTETMTAEGDVIMPVGLGSQ